MGIKELIVDKIKELFPVDQEERIKKIEKKIAELETELYRIQYKLLSDDHAGRYTQERKGR
jgi:RNase P/RNase MRP subunit p29